MFTIENDCVDVKLYSSWSFFVCVLNYDWCKIVLLTGWLNENLSYVVNQLIKEWSH